MKQKIYTIYYKEKFTKYCETIVKKEQEFVADSYEILEFAIFQIWNQDISDFEDVRIFTNCSKWSEEAVLSIWNKSYKYNNYKKRKKGGRVVGSKFYKLKRKYKWRGHPNKYRTENESLINKGANRTKKLNNLPEGKYSFY